MSHNSQQNNIKIKMVLRLKNVNFDEFPPNFKIEFKKFNKSYYLLLISTFVLKTFKTIYYRSIIFCTNINY